MSIILDALRRGRSAPPPGPNPNAAQTDAVLQTLGYGRFNPTAPLNRMKRLLVLLVLGVALAVALWVGTIWLTHAYLARSHAEVAPAPVAAAKPSPKPARLPVEPTTASPPAASVPAPQPPFGIADAPLAGRAAPPAANAPDDRAPVAPVAPNATIQGSRQPETFHASRPKWFGCGATSHSERDGSGAFAAVELRAGQWSVRNAEGKGRAARCCCWLDARRYLSGASAQDKR